MRDGRRRHRLDARVVAHVQGQRQHSAAQRFDLRLKRFQRFRIAAGDDEIRSRFSQGSAEILAKAAAGSSDDGHFSCQIK